MAVSKSTSAPVPDQPFPQTKTSARVFRCKQCPVGPGTVVLTQSTICDPCKVGMREYFRRRREAFRRVPYAERKPVYRISDEGRAE